MSKINARKVAGTLVCVHIVVKGEMSAKVDKARTKQVLDEAGAEKGAAEVRKHVIDKKKWIDPIMANGTKARALVRDNGMPYGEARGMVLMTQDTFRRVLPKLEALKEAFYAAKQHLVDHYSQVYADAMRFSSGMFDPSEFPELIELEKRFQFEIKVTLPPTPTLHGIAFGDASVLADMGDVIESDTAAIYEDAIRAGVDSLKEKVEHLKNVADKAGNGGRVHASAFDKVAGAVDALRGFVDLINDEKERIALTQALDAAELMASLTPDAIKTDTGKAQATKQHDAVMDKLADLTAFA